MSAGEASVFPRIDAEHPLTRAARETNEYADKHGLEATLEWLGIGDPGELAYLGEQRALRAVAASTVGLNMGAPPTALDEQTARAIVETPLWRDMRLLLVGCYLDGFAIGWRGRALAIRDVAGDVPRDWLEQLADYYETEGNYFEREGEQDKAAHWFERAAKVRRFLDGGEGAEGEAPA